MQVPLITVVAGGQCASTYSKGIIIHMLRVLLTVAFQMACLEVVIPILMAYLEAVVPILL